ncbi:hypothetical protein AAVH_22498 [Aphelenchoides avenae]|nr:hypothetical protein AAVH_22498 [Aphelenchus avenae]
MCLVKFGEAAKKIAHGVTKKFGKAPPREPEPMFHFAEGSELETVYNYVPTEDSAERESNLHTPRAPAPPRTPPTTKKLEMEPMESTWSPMSRSLVPMPRRGTSTPQKLRNTSTPHRSLLEELGTTSSSDPILKGSRSSPQADDTPAGDFGSLVQRQKREVRILPPKNKHQIVRIEREYVLRFENDRLIEHSFRVQLEYDF